jgi:tetraacyldisaccharide 4'-kinase
VSFIYRVLIAVRYLLYRSGVFTVQNFDVPIVVIGNLTAGGTGKTPLLIHLARELIANGYRPGVVSRGYGARGPYPVQVTPNTEVLRSGDEPLLIARTLNVPVVVDPDRVNAVNEVLKTGAIDIVLSDDGLQHTRLGRQLEIVVIDGQRGFGNGLLLPAGPLREPSKRLNTVDVVVRHGRTPERGESTMETNLGAAVNINDGRELPLEAFRAKKCVAITAIANPNRFFTQLSAEGLQFEQVEFVDHHYFSLEDLQSYQTSTVLMTEKDAVKCQALAGLDWWQIGQTVRTGGEVVEMVLQVAKRGSAT